MSITVTCPKCGKAIKAPDEAAGKKGKCPACGELFQVPGAAADAAPLIGEPPASPDEHPAAALARAMASISAGPQPATIVPAAEAPTSAPPADAAPPPAPPGDGDAGEGDSSELIAGPPIGVQTPSGLPARPRLGAAHHRWQRKLAGYVKYIGLGLGVLSLAAGIAVMFFMALQGSDYLMPGIGLFVLLFVVGAMSFLGGLLARHMLLLLADLGEDVRYQDDLLDRINDRLA